MNRDQIRALAGMPTKNDADSRIQLNEIKHAAVENDGHFDLKIADENVGKVAKLLAVEGLPVDITYDGVENFYFNFKSSKLKAQAEALIEKWVIESAKVVDDEIVKE